MRVIALVWWCFLVVVLVVLCGVGTPTKGDTDLPPAPSPPGAGVDGKIHPADKSWFVHGPADDLDYSSTALLIVDMYDFVGVRQWNLQLFKDTLPWLRAKGVTVIHLCFGCSVPWVLPNGVVTSDQLLMEAAAAEKCYFPPIRGQDEIRVLDNERFPRMLWPFAGFDPTSNTLQDVCHIMEEEENPVKGPLQCTLDDTVNSVRKPQPPSTSYSVKEELVESGDVITQDEDLVWRLLRHKNIKNLIFSGIDANECVLWSRPLSLVRFLSHGWDPERLFVLPQLAFSGNYHIQGALVSFTHFGSHVWSSALFRHFRVRSLCVGGRDNEYVLYYCQEPERRPDMHS